LFLSIVVVAMRHVAMTLTRPTLSGPSRSIHPHQSTLASSTGGPMLLADDSGDGGSQSRTSRAETRWCLATTRRRDPGVPAEHYPPPTCRRPADAQVLDVDVADTVRPLMPAGGGSRDGQHPTRRVTHDRSPRARRDAVVASGQHAQRGAEALSLNGDPVRLPGTDADGSTR